MVGYIWAIAFVLAFFYFLEKVNNPLSRHTAYLGFGTIAFVLVGIALSVNYIVALFCAFIIFVLFVQPQIRSQFSKKDS